MATIEKIYIKKNDTWIQKKQVSLSIYKFKNGRRNISFISSEGNDRLINDHVKGFCHAKFKANFVISNIDMDSLAEGMLLQIGNDTVIRITEVGKECFVDCPVVKKFNTLCLINKQIFFSEILKPGVIKEKDKVILI